VDDKGRKFTAVNYCRYCYNIIYQEEPLFIRKQADENEKLCQSSFRYEFTTEDDRQTAMILSGKIEEPVQLGHFRSGIE
jgi:putative protease